MRFIGKTQCGRQPSNAALPHLMPVLTSLCQLRHVARLGICLGFWPGRRSIKRVHQRAKLGRIVQDSATSFNQIAHFSRRNRKRCGHLQQTAPRGSVRCIAQVDLHDVNLRIRRKRFCEARRPRCQRTAPRVNRILQVFLRFARSPCAGAKEQAVHHLEHAGHFGALVNVEGRVTLGVDGNQHQFF